MKEQLATSFIAASLTDSITTAIGVHVYDFIELNPLARQAIETGHTNSVVLLKMGVITGMTALYAYTSRDNSRWNFSVEKSIMISNVLLWSVAASNAAQILIEAI